MPDYRGNMEKLGTVLWGCGDVSLEKIHIQTRISTRMYQDRWLFEKIHKSRWYKTRWYGYFICKRGGLIAKFHINTYNAKHTIPFFFFFWCFNFLVFKEEKSSEHTIIFSKSQNYQKGTPVVLLYKYNFSTKCYNLTHTLMAHHSMRANE